MKNNTIIKALTIPFGLLALTLIWNVLWKIFDWPKGDELIAIIAQFFEHYGLWIVFVCSILESGLLIGNFFPGGIVIFLSVIAAGHNIPRIILTVSIVCVGFFIGYTLDYLLGKYGWYKLLAKFGLTTQIERAKERLMKQSFNAIILSYWEVNLASITATAAGVLQMDIKKFLLESTISIIVWNIFWGVLVASLGKKALNLVTNLVYIIPVIIGWVSIILIKHYWDRRQNRMQ